MNMPMPIPLPLQLLQSQRFSVPPVLRRALLCCVVALVGALVFRVLSVTWHAEAETERNDARAGMQKTSSLLASTLETEAVRAARAKRFALVKAVLENMPAEQPEWEQLTRQLSASPHIVDPILNTLPVQPAFPAPEPVSNAILAMDGEVSEKSVHGAAGSPEPYRGNPGRKAGATQDLPVITLQRVRVEAGLLHEEALLALDAIVTGAPAHIIPIGCSLQRETDAAPITLRASCEFDRITLVPSSR